MHRLKCQIAFEASCEVVSVARSPRSALTCVSRHRSQRAASVRRIGSEMPFLVGHPGLEPGANGLRTQRLTAHKALLLSDPDTPTRPIPVTAGHVPTYSGHRDRLDRAGLLRAIAHAREAKVMTEGHARTLTELVEQFGDRWS
jgi:hypothetical protein